MMVVLLAPAVMDMLVIHLPSDVKERVSSTDPILKSLKFIKLKTDHKNETPHTFSVEGNFHPKRVPYSFTDELIYGTVN